MTDETYTFDFNVSGMMLSVDFSEVESIDGKKTIEPQDGPITRLELFSDGLVIAYVSSGYPFPSIWIVRKGMKIFENIKYRDVVDGKLITVNLPVVCPSEETNVQQV